MMTKQEAFDWAHDAEYGDWLCAGSSAFDDQTLAGVDMLLRSRNLRLKEADDGSLSAGWYEGVPYPCSWLGTCKCGWPYNNRGEPDCDSEVCATEVDRHDRA